MNVLLINEAVLKSVGLINDNTDSCYIMPSIVLAQEVSLQELIGSKLLRKLKKLVNDGDIDKEEYADYKLLLTDYIRDYLIWATTSEIQIPVSFKTTNSGSVQNQDEHKYGNDIKSVEYLKEYYKDKARFFGKLLQEYLCANSNKYPEYHQCAKDGIHASDESYCGVYFPDNRYGRRHWK